MSFIVGLTGGMGSGKSTVAGLFAERGAGVVDTDAISHRLTQSCGEAIEAIRAAFGEKYITGDGALDRARMRGLIFSDSDAKHRLEKILHPLILRQATAELERLRALPYIVVVVPLLAQSPAFLRLVQRVLVVDCDESAQVERVVRRSAMGEKEVRSIIAQQSSRQQRLQIADDVIHNDAGLDSLAEQVSVLHKRYLGMNNGN